AFWPTALCLGVMCILQATLNITLRLNFNLEAETDLLNTSFYNLTIDELRNTCTDLLKEKNRLHLDRDQLQIRNTNLGKERDEIKASNNNLVKEKDELTKNKDTLQRMFPKIVALISLGWIHFHSSLYYISTVKKSWGMSRVECKMNDADLVIINSKEEEDFIIKLLGNKSQAWVGLKMITGMEWKWVDDRKLSSG
ncbi:C-type lectin domain family 4 member E-like isoform X1, partial [Clarias magur]